MADERIAVRLVTRNFVSNRKKSRAFNGRTKEMRIAVKMMLESGRPLRPMLRKKPTRKRSLKAPVTKGDI